MIPTFTSARGGRAIALLVLGLAIAACSPSTASTAPSPSVAPLATPGATPVVTPSPMPIVTPSGPPTAAASPSAAALPDPARDLTIGTPYTLTALDPALETSFRQQFASSAGAFGSLVGIGGREVVQNGSLAGYVIVIGFPAGILSDAAYQSMLTGIQSSSAIAFKKTTVSGVEVSSGATSNAGMSVYRNGDNVNLTITPTEASLAAVTTALVTANH